MTSQQRISRALALVSGLIGLLGGVLWFVSSSTIGLMVLALGLGAFIWLLMGNTQPASKNEPSARTEVNEMMQVVTSTQPIETDPTPQFALKTSATRKTITLAKPSIADILKAKVPVYWVVSALVFGLLLGWFTSNRSVGGAIGTQTLADNRITSGQAPLVGAVNSNSPTTNMTQAQVNIGGKPVLAKISELDMGRVQDGFDGNRDSLFRGRNANPFVIELNFAEVRDVSAISLDLASMENVEIKVFAVKTDGASVESKTEWRENRIEPTVDISLPGSPLKLNSLRVEILDRRAPPNEGFHTHVREVRVK